jgi:hypothetical protein
MGVNVLDVLEARRGGPNFGPSGVGALSMGLLDGVISGFERKVKVARRDLDDQVGTMSAPRDHDRGRQLDNNIIVTVFVETGDEGALYVT